MHALYKCYDSILEITYVYHGIAYTRSFVQGVTSASANYISSDQ